MEKRIEIQINKLRAEERTLKGKRRDLNSNDERAQIGQRLYEIRKQIDTGEEKLSQIRVILKLLFTSCSNRY